ncbi:MmcQ/YjbR family DNA-binding protein [Cryobacterium sp. AP23]
MNGRKLQERAADRIQALPGAELTHPFGERWDVYKVRGKVFMLQTEVGGEPVVTLKSKPDNGLSLQQEFTEITPGYHMNKRHWITLHPGDGLGLSLVDELVTESYLLVVENLPRNQRPVDPASFGQHPEE